MITMLGKEFPVLEVVGNGIIALPSPDGSFSGKWYFHTSVVRPSGKQTNVKCQKYQLKH